MTHTNEVEHLYEGSHKTFAQIHRDAWLKGSIKRVRKELKRQQKLNPQLIFLRITARSFSESLVFESLGFTNHGKAINLFGAGDSYTMAANITAVEKLLADVDKARTGH